MTGGRVGGRGEEWLAAEHIVSFKHEKSKTSPLCFIFDFSSGVVGWGGAGGGRGGWCTLPQPNMPSRAVSKMKNQRMFKTQTFKKSKIQKIKHSKSTPISKMKHQKINYISKMKNSKIQKVV